MARPASTQEGMAARTVPHWGVAPVTLTVTGSAADSDALDEGMHRFISDVPFHMIQTSSGGTSATTSHHYFAANVEYWIWVKETGTDDVMSVIRAGAVSGTAWISKVN